MYENIEVNYRVLKKVLWDAFQTSHKTSCFLSLGKYYFCSKLSHDINF